MQDLPEILNVVLAEDDPDDLVIFQLAIDSLPLDIHLTHEDDGEKLLALLRRYIPDIIFLDINLPQKNGINCISEIRKDTRLDNVPVIMYTAHTHEKFIGDSFSGGANFYLLKSNSVSELARRLGLVFSVKWKKFSYYPPKSQFVIGAGGMP